MNCFYCCVIRFIHEVDHDDPVMLPNKEDVWSSAWCDLQSFNTAIELYAFDYLVELEVADE